MAKRIILLIVKSTNSTVANDPVPTFALELQGWYILDGRMKSQQYLDNNTVIDFSAFSSYIFPTYFTDFIYFSNHIIQEIENEKSEGTTNSKYCLFVACYFSLLQQKKFIQSRISNIA